MTNGSLGETELDSREESPTDFDLSFITRNMMRVGSVVGCTELLL